MINRLLTVAKIAVPIAILAWLFSDLRRNQPDLLSHLIARPKHFGLIALGFATLLAATSCSFLRWYGLVRALRINLKLGDAFKLGFLGCLFNFVGPGAVGGDLVKAYLLVRKQRSRQAEAAATILLDRIVGLYSLLVVASLAILFSDYSHLPGVASVIRTVPWLAAIGGVAIVALLAPGTLIDKMLAPARGIHCLARPLTRLLEARDLYRQQRVWLVLIGLLSLLVHILIAVSIHLVDRGIHPTTPTLKEHVVLISMANVAGAIPVPGGLGTYEAAMVFLYRNLPTATMEPGQGLTVAICYRLMSILVAAVGIPFYWLQRESVSEAVEEATRDHVAADEQMAAES